MCDFATYAIAAIVSFSIASVLIGWGIPHLRRDEGDADDSASVRPKRVFDWKSAGLWIGLCEVAIVFVLVLQSEYGALAVIFGAKEYVRKDRIKKDPAHYLLGTMANLALAILFALLARWLVGDGGGSLPQSSSVIIRSVL